MIESAKIDKNGFKSHRLESKISRLASKIRKEFPTEEDCWEEVFKRLYPDGIRCKFCNGNRFEYRNNNRAVKCLDCREKTWLTSGTFFHRVKSVGAWMMAIRFVEEGVILNSKELEALGQVAQSSALNILKKINLVILGMMENKSETCHSGELIAVFCKRSRETPRRKHPLCEQEEFEKEEEEEQTSFFDTDKHNEAGLSEDDKRVLDLLKNQSMSVQKLANELDFSVGQLSAVLMVLEINGLVQRCTGDRYQLVANLESTRQKSNQEKEESTINLLVGHFTSFVRQNCHGISRKYLQLYLAAHWFMYRKKQLKKGNLLKSCLGFGQITDKQILMYTTPLVVKVLGIKKAVNL